MCVCFQYEDYNYSKSETRVWRQQMSFPRPPGAVLWLPKNQHNSDGLTNKSTPVTKFYYHIIISRYQVSSLETPRCIVVIYRPKYFKAVTILFFVSSQNRQNVER